eukprot:s1531_g6.t1
MGSLAGYSNRLSPVPLSLGPVDGFMIPLRLLPDTIYMISQNCRHLKALWTMCKADCRHCLPRSNEELFEFVKSSPGTLTWHAGSSCETDPEILILAFHGRCLQRSGPRRPSRGPLDTAPPERQQCVDELCYVPL